MDAKTQRKLFEKIGGSKEKLPMDPIPSEVELEEAKHVFERMLKAQKELKESLEVSLSSFPKDI